MAGLRTQALNIAKGIGQKVSDAGWNIAGKLPNATMQVNNSTDSTSALSMARRKAMNRATPAQQAKAGAVGKTSTGIGVGM